MTHTEEYIDALVVAYGTACLLNHKPEELARIRGELVNEYADLKSKNDALRSEVIAHRRLTDLMTADIEQLKADNEALRAQLATQGWQPIGHELRLWDTQWMSIVDNDMRWESFTKEDAVLSAVKMTELAMAKNFMDSNFPPRAQLRSAGLGWGYEDKPITPQPRGRYEASTKGRT